MPVIIYSSILRTTTFNYDKTFHNNLGRLYKKSAGHDIKKYTRNECARISVSKCTDIKKRHVITYYELRKRTLHN